MTRLRYEDSRRPGGESGSGAGEDTMNGRSLSAINQDSGGARIRRPHEDPSGRRSLTGLEFRRLRSI